VPSAHALGLGDVRWKLTCPICGKHFAQRGFEPLRVLLSSRVHVRHSDGGLFLFNGSSLLFGIKYEGASRAIGSLSRGGFGLVEDKSGYQKQRIKHA